jgi:hypothetical protein
MRKTIKKIKKLIDRLLHPHCGTPNCCGRCENATIVVKRKK